MDREQKELMQEATAFMGLEVWHYANKYIITGREFVMGECIADILNYDFAVFDKAHSPALALAQSTQRNQRLDFELIAKMQNIVNAVVDALFNMLPYKELQVDKAQLYDLFTGFYRRRYILSKRFNNDDKKILAVLSSRLFMFRTDIQRIKMLYTDFLDNYVWSGNTQPDGKTMAAAYDRFLDELYDEKKHKNYTDYSGRSFTGKTLFNFTIPPVIDFGVPPPGALAPGLCEVITFLSLFDFARWEISQSMIAGNLIKRCKCCGKFFAMEPGYVYEYCANIAPGEIVRTCRDVGALKSHEEKIKNDPVWAAYRRAYKKYHARVRKKTMTQADFQAWADSAIELRERAVIGEISVEELRVKLNEGHAIRKRDCDNENKT